MSRTSASVGLPPRPFLYTLDQIATLIATPIERVRTDFVFYAGRSVGAHDRKRMLAVNINPDADGAPEWRVAENELVRWMRLNRIRVYERTWRS
jgi:hypothetical protein